MTGSADAWLRVVSKIARSGGKVPAALSAARDEAVAMRAASYDGVVVGGGRSEMWCEPHERDVRNCHVLGLRCTGVPVSVSDPTGEAAISSRGDGRAERVIRGHITAIEDHLDALLAEVAAVSKRAPRTREEKDAARRQLDERERMADDNDERCWSCARVHVAPDTPWDCGARRGQGGNLRRTDCGGVLDEARPLCKWTRRYVERWGRLPSPDEIRRRAAA